MILNASYQKRLASMAVLSFVWLSVQAKNLSLTLGQATLVAMVMLASCDHSSVTRNGQWIKWMKVDASRAATTAHTSIALVPEGRQRIVVCYITIIKKFAKLGLAANFQS